eukprot:gb/GFBE01056657.1/.p1 GENE.gb/GFBE01056657.1/~~gb/GFBE01056657.1/.p1  ORF type:complete len:408 (+),score=57.63 gb/GFBE01056657.1/:1-1224(+)
MMSSQLPRGLYGIGGVEGLRRGQGPVTSGMGPGLAAPGRPGLGGAAAGLQVRMGGAGPGSLGMRDDRHSGLGKRPRQFPGFQEANLLSQVPPPLPSHLGGGLGTASSHGSAGSRSQPAGRRHERPTTPSGSYHPSRRSGADDPGSRWPAALPQGPSAVDSRDPRDVLLPARNLAEANPRSRSHAAPGGSRWGGSVSSTAGVQHREGLSSGGSSGSTTCDKCDGKHTTDRCPHYHKDREKHKDAWVNYGRKGDPHQMGANGGNFILRSARVMRQPGDGSCLFHSLLHGLQSGGSASSLRREIAAFLQQNPSMQIAGDTLEEWVKWDSNSSVNEYARRMSVGGWGGGIEMACCSLLKGVNVHVYEHMGSRGASSEFKRISCFDAPNAARTIHVLYQGGVHYDALQPLVA